jgi:hypothetical protein
MRRTWVGLIVLATAMLSLLGCWTTDTPLKPAALPEEVRLPPRDDPRFSQPPSYPEKTLNQGLIAKDRKKEDKEDPGANFHSGGRGGPGGGY